MSGTKHGGLSRRDFLKRSGAAALSGLSAPGVTPVDPHSAIADFVAYPAAGRPFDVTELRTAPDEAAPVAGQLLPDGVTSIVGLSDDGRWYEIEAKGKRGYIPRSAAQPIVPYSRPALVDEIGRGFWAEVVAPSSTIRQWCHATAPIIDSLGYGAVVYVMDRIIAHGQVWYGMSSAPGAEFVGWAVSLQYAPIISSHLLSESVSHNGLSSALVVISSQDAELRVLDGSRLLMRTPMLGMSQQRGETTLSAIRPGGPISDRRPLGLPWQMQLGSGQAVYGVFWHNDFGMVNGNEDTIELPVLAARYLYGLLGQPLRAVVV